MGRCPTFLKADDFDRLAASLNIKLTDKGVSALGEIIELITTQILSHAQNKTNNSSIDVDTIIETVKDLGVDVSIDMSIPKINRAVL